MKFGAFVSPGHPSLLLEKAKMLEENGFDSVWVEDEILLPFSSAEEIVPDLFPSLAAIAVSTRRVNVGSCVIDAGARYPVKVAQAIAAIDSIANGRMIAGIGGGEAINHDPFGIPTYHVYQKMEEAIRCIRLLLTADHAEPANFSGRFFSLKDAYLKIKSPRRPHTPLYISAFGPKALHLAGSLGDGWISFSHTPKTYQAILNGPIRTAAQETGRSLDSIGTVLSIQTVLSKDLDIAARAAAAQAKDWIVLSPDNMKLIVPGSKHMLGRQPYAARAGREWAEKLEALSGQIPDRAALGTTLWGDTASIIEQVDRFAKAGCRHLIIYPTPLERGTPVSLGKWSETIREVGGEVIPYFKDM
jgi:alkanesulfonate monooxygenase SsuD/methylene tetrahydromethanopterin reductase-like flavin-dependent oxidoreductase (luciferase family)